MGSLQVNQLLRYAVKGIITRATTSKLSTSTSCSAQIASDYLISRSKHLRSGDDCPHLSPGTLRLYSMKWCPFAQRSRLALAYKRVRYEEVNVNLAHKPKWLFDKNPEGAVPVLEMYSNDSRSVKHVIGSLEICEWLEEVYIDTPPLFSNIINNALNSDILSEFKTVSRVMNDYIYDRLEVDLQSTTQTNCILLGSLISLDAILDRDLLYLSANTVTITDFLLWPFFERCLAKGLTLESQSLPTLSKWVDRMSALPAVRDVRNSDRGYKLYWQSLKSGSIEYDVDV